MERDSIIAHGASYLLHERLLNSSDRHPAVICDKCGSILSATAKQMTQQEVATMKNKVPKSRKRWCWFVMCSDVPRLQDQYFLPYYSHAICHPISGQWAGSYEYQSTVWCGEDFVLKPVCLWYYLFALKEVYQIKIIQHVLLHFNFFISINSISVETNEKQKWWYSFPNKMQTMSIKINYSFP